MKRKPRKTRDSSTLMETAQRRAKKSLYVLRLYVSGTTPHSQLALSNIKRICEEFLEGRYKLHVIDVYQYPLRAKEEQIVAAPTLIKASPLPFKRLIGDLSDEQKVLLGLGISSELRGRK